MHSYRVTVTTDFGERVEYVMASDSFDAIAVAWRMLRAKANMGRFSGNIVNLKIEKVEKVP